MKIRIEVDKDLKEDEITIKCAELTDNIKKVQQAISSVTQKTEKFTFYKENVEFYISLEEILFFETEANIINAHTKHEVYQVKYKLYELEQILPINFLRVSKSSILNIDKIFSITKNLTSSSEVQFQNTHKQVYVSRYYYKILKTRLDEKRGFASGTLM